MPLENKKIVDGANRSSIGLTKLQFKTIDGLKIRYVTDEATKGDLIVLLLPVGLRASMPSFRHGRLSPRSAPLLAVDLPGFGRSRKSA